MNLALRNRGPARPVRLIAGFKSAAETEKKPSASIRFVSLLLFLNFFAHVSSVASQTPTAQTSPATTSQTPSATAQASPATTTSQSASTPATAQSSTSDSTSAQKPQVKTSRVLSNFYVGLEIGGINYAFSDAQLQPGFHAQPVEVPHLAARVVLFGHEFGKYLSVQLTDMRPIEWVKYDNLSAPNQTFGNFTVWMNVGGLTAKGRLPLGARWSLIGEGGVGLVTRRGFAINQTPVVNNASYATFLYGAGLDYRLNAHWDFLTEVTVAPGNASDNQPATYFFAGGFNYTLRRVTAETAGENTSNTPIWPKNVIEVGYITNALGYGVNNFLTKGKVPVFWPGAINVANGFAVNFTRNLFHSRRWFALDWGTQVSGWRSMKDGERFATVAVFPAVRIPLIRTNPFEFYFTASDAGPALITRTTIDGQATGRTFTFQDYMGLGTYWGRKRRVTAEIKIEHYSNGNLFPENPGLTIPLGFYLGTSF